MIAYLPARIGPPAPITNPTQPPFGRQAEADAATLRELLATAGATVQRHFAVAAREAEAGRAEAAAARSQLAQQAEAFRAVLKETLHRTEEQQRQQLRRQAEELAMAHAGEPCRWCCCC